MLDKMFGFVPKGTITQFAFSYEHLILAVVCFLALAVLLLLLRKASIRQKKLVTLCVVMAFLILEIARLLWKYIKLVKLGSTQSIWQYLDLNLTTIVVWLSIILLTISLFTNRYSKFNRLVYTFVFSMGVMAAGYFFIYPVHLDGGYGMLHIINLIDILINSLLLFIGLFIGFTDLIEISIDDNWVSWLTILLFVGVGFGFYYWSGGEVNFLFVKECAPLKNLGMNIPFPYHMIIVTIILLAVNILIYIPFEIISKRRLKKIGKSR